MIYDFDWDPTKAETNRRKHQVTFVEAATVFKDPRALSIYDPDHSKDEERWITIGLSAWGRLLVVCHTFREIDKQRNVIRIISSRKADREEVRLYAD